MSTPSEPRFDWSQAASLLGDDPSQVGQDMADIVKELVDTAEGQFQELKTKDIASDKKTIASLAHQLRGCLLNFGFEEVGSHLLHIEKDAYPGSDYPVLVEKAYAAFIASRKMLGARYPTLGIS